MLLARVMQEMYSFWEQDLLQTPQDLLIVGGGFVGLSAALFVKQQHPKWKVRVWEQSPFTAGGSTRNAGFACFGSLSELMDDLEHLPEDAVLELVRMRWEGLQRLRKICGDDYLQFKATGGYECFTDRRNYEKCVALLPRFNRYLAPVTGSDRTFVVADQALPQFGFIGVQHLIFNTREGQLHPGRAHSRLRQLATRAGVEILSGIRVESLRPHPSKGWALRLEGGGSAFGRKVLLANNGMAAALIPTLELRPVRNQVLITHPIKDLRVRGCFHFEKGYYYFRNVGNRLLLGGGRHLDVTAGEETGQLGGHNAIRTTLLDFLHQIILPGQPVAVDQWWSGILGVGPQKWPIVESIQPNLYAAVRLGGMGVAIGSLLGQQAAEKICSEA